MTLRVGGVCAQFVLCALLVSATLAQSPATMQSFPVKVVVVTMFEGGEDTGDAPGEFQLWVEREHLDQILPLPAGYRHGV